MERQMTQQEINQLPAVPHTRGVYRTDGSRLYRDKREVPLNKKGMVHIYTSQGARWFSQGDLAAIYREERGEIGMPLEGPRLPSNSLQSETTPSTSEESEAILGPSGGSQGPITGTPIAELGLGGRVVGILAHLGIRFVEQIPSDLDSLTELQGVGPAHAEQIETAVIRWAERTGLTVGDEE